MLAPNVAFSFTKSKEGTNKKKSQISCCKANHWSTNHFRRLPKRSPTLLPKSPSVEQYPLPAAATHPNFKSFLLFSYRWLQGACLSPNHSVSCGLLCPLLTAQGPPNHVVPRKVHGMAELTQQPVLALCSLQKGSTSACYFILFHLTVSDDFDYSSEE